MTHFSFEAIGTFWQIDISEYIRSTVLSGLQSSIQNRIETYDRTYSRFRNDSVITAMSQNAGTYNLPSDSDILFSTYKRIYKSTNGYVTPLIGQLLSDAGYDADYTLKPKNVLKRPMTWQESFDYRKNTVTIYKPCLLDFGAAGKGHLIDIVSELIEKAGYASYTVDAGGDIRYRNKENKSLTVGLEHPFDTSRVIGVANITDCSMCGSAGNRRAWGTFHHIMDPMSMTPVKSITAVWTVASTTIMSDALSTCLFFVEPSKLKEEYDFEYVIMRPDFSIEYSNNFPGELFIS